MGAGQSVNTRIEEDEGNPLTAIQPLFICLGVPKAATTWIHRQLEAHPDIGTTLSKEINYWSSNYQNGPTWYVKRFPRDRAYHVYAEVSVGYLREPVIQRLADDVPHARFMVSLRNPYERAWSSYWQSVRNGAFKGGLRQALEGLPKITQDSLYSPGIEAFFQRFPRDRLHVALYDELVADPHAFTRGIYEFAKVDPNLAPDDLHRRMNEGRRHSIVDETLSRTQTFVKRLGLTRGHLVHMGAWPSIEWIYARLAKKRPLPPLQSDDWDLLDEYLGQEVTRLERVLDLDLSDWRMRPEPCRQLS